MNQPSAVKPWKLQAVMPADNRNSLRLIGQAGAIAEQGGANFRQHRYDKQTDELRDELINSMSPEAKQEAAQQLSIAQERDAQVAQADAQAQEKRQILTENGYKEWAVTNPEAQRAYLELADHNPEAAAAVMDIFAQRDEAQNRALVAQVQEAQRMWNNLEYANGQSPEAYKELAYGMARQVKARGGDPSDILSTIDMPADKRSGVILNKKSQAGAFFKIPDAKSQLELQKHELEVQKHGLDVRKQDHMESEANKPENTGGDITNPSPKDFTVESIAEWQRTGDAAVLERYHSASDKRGQEIIDKGLTAAEAMPNINRAIDLVATVETGGIDAAQLKAKQLLGIEGADEAELNRNLRSAVLSQLKTIFGTQFTQQEGKLLQDIEANFGKSNAGNKRILQQTKRVLNVRVQRAVKRAEVFGDYGTIDDINAYLDLDLSEDLNSPQVVDRTLFGPESSTIGRFQVTVGK